MDDGARLMERLREHDRAAFEHLYDGYHRLVFGIALRMLSDETMAEDLVQTVFMKLWATPGAFREGNFSAWLARVARNSALDVLRRRSSRKTDVQISVDVAEGGALDETVFSLLNAERVRGALAELSADQRDAIEMGFFEGITHEEIAKRTGIPLGTIKTRIRSGLRRLRDTLHDSVAR
jgi:RNA polymerase sigma-70 factor (ECF subfamily)